MTAYEIRIRDWSSDVCSSDLCPKEVIEKDGVKALDSAAELYKTCQFVSLHIPATAETKNSINYGGTC